MHQPVSVEKAREHEKPRLRVHAGWCSAHIVMHVAANECHVDSGSEAFHHDASPYVGVVILARPVLAPRGPPWRAGSTKVGVVKTHGVVVFARAYAEGSVVPNVAVDQLDDPHRHTYSAARPTVPLTMLGSSTCQVACVVGVGRDDGPHDCSDGGSHPGRQKQQAEAAPQAHGTAPNFDRWY